MPSVTAAGLRFAVPIFATVLMALPAAWGVLALWFQAPGNQLVKALLMTLWAAFSLAAIMALWQGRAMLGLIAFALAFALFLLWWHYIPPSNNRIWADDVARVSSGTVDGSLVTLHNVRNFNWRTDDDYTVQWETRTYDLERLQSVDMIMSYWTGPAIAHMLISFGFDDGRHVVFSVEIRRERRESYSELGGFFKAFDLAIIAADERDIVRVRTNVRGEDDYLYHLRMPLYDIRALFLRYLDEANALQRVPRFYNTITVNCTTLVYHMMKRIVGHLPLDYRLLLSGYLPEYVYKVGGLDTRYPLAELRQRGRITDRAKAADRSEDFSAAIRARIPALDPVAQ